MAGIDKVLQSAGKTPVAAQTGLEYRVSLLQENLQGAPDVPDCDWCHDRCLDSEIIHEAVWRWNPPASFVEQAVVPALERTITIVNRAVAKDDQESALLLRFPRNIGRRVQNLTDNYLKGRPSDFPPDDPLLD